MRYILNRPLVHNGRLYKADDVMVDLPEPAKLKRWLRNQVVRKERGEAELQAKESAPAQKAPKPPKADTKKGKKADIGTGEVAAEQLVGAERPDGEQTDGEADAQDDVQGSGGS